MDFLKKAVTIQWKAWKKKKISCCLQTNKVLDSRNSKEHYESFLERKIKNQ